MECVKEVAHRLKLAKRSDFYFYNRRNEIPERAVGALIPNHGIVIAAKDLDEAFTPLTMRKSTQWLACFRSL